MKVAIVHDWLTVAGGAEKVLAQFLTLFPEADLFTVVDFLPEKDRGFLEGRKVTTSFIQKLPLAEQKYRWYLSLMPLAVEQFDLSDYDLVLSSSYAVAKGVITGPDQVHISYVHSPMRYAWDLQHQYLRESGLDRGLLGWVAKWQLSRLRIWDQRTSNGVDTFIANSQFIARRIRKVYGREAAVVYPPVDVDKLPMEKDKDDYYVTVSRMVPYKRIDLIAEAFRWLPERRLVVIGAGPEFLKVREKAGPNVELLGAQPTEVVHRYLRRARAFLFAAEEDFGIAPVEAQACGTPVIAYGRGGVLESIAGPNSANPTGLFYPEQTPQALAAAIREFEARASVFSPFACRRNAMRFSVARFQQEIRALVGPAVVREREQRDAA
jgi:glycosyltransferase involved in cell wall biosynthesis